MVFKVSKIPGAAQFDSLPVAKITTYPLEQRDYKPYAQCVLCFSAEDRLSMRLWAFEVSPMPSSCLKAALHLFRDKPELSLCVEIFSDGRARAGVGGTEFEITAKPHNGEDLQGAYWGGTVEIPLTLLENLGGPLFCEVGDEFTGNFFKTCTQRPFEHYGYFFPPESKGIFVVVGY